MIEWLLLAVLAVSTGIFLLAASFKFGLVSPVTMLGATFVLFLLFPATDYLAIGAYDYWPTVATHDLSQPHHREILRHALGLLIGAMVAAIAVVLAAPASLPANPERVRDLVRMRARRWGLLLMGLGVLAIIAGMVANGLGMADVAELRWQERTGAIFAMDSPVALLLLGMTRCIPIGVFLLILPELLHERQWRFAFGIGATLAVVIAIFAVWGARVMGLELMAWAFFAVFWLAPASRRRWMVLVLPVVFVLFVLAFFVRSYLHHGIDYAFHRADLDMDRISQWDRVRAANEVFDFHFYLYVIEHREPGNALDMQGRTLMRGLVFWIPRSFWPEKPIAFQVVLSNYASPSSAADASISSTVFGEAHANFGDAGSVLVFPLLVGLAIAATSALNRPRSLAAFMGYLYACTLALQYGRWDVTGPVINALPLLAILAAVGMAERMWRASGDESPAAATPKA